MITRFAPSPTGYLHLGHAYAALYAYDLAVKNGGEFLLRHEDIDVTRVRDEYYLAIEEDLLALGIVWQSAPLRQMDRQLFYMQALERLKSLEVVYPCFCTRRRIQEEVSMMGNAPHGPEGALYPGICRRLSEDECLMKMTAGHSHCWRLDAGKASLLTGDLSFKDQFYGEVAVDSSLLGDVVLARKDIATSYHLAVVVDDAYQGVTDVTRGEDLLSSTHVHRILQELLKLAEPYYHHHALVLDGEGKRLAKRSNSLSLRALIGSGQTADEMSAKVRSSVL